MVTKVDVQALAALARLEVSDEELVRLEKELPSILLFVETIQKVAVNAPMGEPMLKNVMREDGTPHKSGMYTEDLLAAAPAREGDRIAVKQVISKSK